MRGWKSGEVEDGGSCEVKLFSKHKDQVKGKGKVRLVGLVLVENALCLQHKRGYSLDLN